MTIRIIDDRDAIARFLGRSPSINLYLIGDLDDFFRPYTTWYALTDGDDILSLALLYSGMETPTLLCFHDEEAESNITLLKGIIPKLPGRFYAHLSPGLSECFSGSHNIELLGRDDRMILRQNPPAVDDPSIRRLDRDDIASLLKFYKAAYPGNWFDPRMIETGKYFGYFIDKSLAGAAGIHVYSPEYSIAALGNIATLPVFRGMKIAGKLTSVLCSDLLETVKLIGL
ncbi:MAG: hypothetical protein U0X39_16780, partial [Bacteroidales bacterium]